MTMTMERPTEIVELHDEHDAEKVCNWTHVVPERAAFETICLGCGKFSGYACGMHEKGLIKIMNSTGVDGQLVCRQCHTRNRFEFFPL